MIIHTGLWLLDEGIRLRADEWNSRLFLLPFIPVSTSTGRTVPDVQPDLPLLRLSISPVRDIPR